MSKYFTYSNIPEHQVAIYHDDDERLVDGERNVKQDFVGYIITGICSVLLILTLPVSVFFFVKVLRDYERAVVFRLGRLLKPKGPGIVLIMPCLDRWTRIDMRARAFSVPPQEVLTKDEGWVSVGADVQFHLEDPVLAQTAIQDLNHSLRMLAQTTLVNCLASRTILQAETDKKFINLQIQNGLNDVAKKWGAEVERVTISEVRVLREAPVNEGVDIVNLFKGGPNPSTMNLLSGLFASASGGTTQPASFKALKKNDNNSDVLPANLVQLAQSVLDESLVRELGGLYQFNVLGENGGSWIMDLRSGSGRITATSTPWEKPDVVLTMTVENMRAIFQGGVSPFNAYMQELLTVEGDLKMAMNLEVIIDRIKRRQMPSEPRNPRDKSGVFIV